MGQFVIKRVSLASIAAMLLVALTTTDVAAGTRAYDIGTLLFEQNPFETNKPLPPVVAEPTPPPQSLETAPAPYSTQPIPVAPSPYAAMPARPVAPPQPAYQPPVYQQPAYQQPGLRESEAAPAPSPASAVPAAGPPPQSPRLISEIRTGLMKHDFGPFSRTEEDGVDANLELLFVSPDIFDIILSPRPHAGFSINSAGDTSSVYGGLTWEWQFWRGWFADFSFGGSVNNGKNTTDRIDRKELGCHLLFRESLSLGYRFGAHHSISAMLDHISNGRICEKNEGLDSFGIRYGYKF